MSSGPFKAAPTTGSMSFSAFVTQYYNPAMAALLSASGQVGIPGADGGLYPYERPGVQPRYFTADTSLKDPQAYANLDPSGIVATSEGSGFRLTGAGYVLTKQLWPVTATDTYRAGLVFLRTQAPADPSGDTLRFGLLCYDGSGTQVADLTLQDWTAPAVSSLQSLVSFFTRQSGAPSGIATLPDGTRAVRPYFRAFGGVQQTVLLSLSWNSGEGATTLAAIQAQAAAAASAASASTALGAAALASAVPGSPVFPSSAATTVPAGVPANGTYFAASADGKTVRLFSNNGGTPAPVLNVDGTQIAIAIGQGGGGSTGALVYPYTAAAVLPSGVGAGGSYFAARSDGSALDLYQNEGLAAPSPVYQAGAQVSLLTAAGVKAGVQQSVFPASDVQPLVAYNPINGITAVAAIPRTGAATPFDANDVIRYIDGKTYGLAPDGVTLTVNAEANPSTGRTTMHRVQAAAGTATDGILYFAGANLAAGNYRFQVKLKTSAGASSQTQTLRFGSNSSLQPITVTGTAQAFTTPTIQITAATTLVFAIAARDTSNSAYDVAFDEVRLIKGGGAAVAARDGHLLFGPAQAAAGNPDLSGKVIPPNATLGQAPLAAPVALASGFTMIALVRLDAIPSGFGAVLAGDNGFYFGPSATGGNWNAPNPALTSALALIWPGNVNAPFANLANRGWAVVCGRIKDGKQDVSVNGLPLTVLYDAYAAQTISELLTGAIYQANGVAIEPLNGAVGPIRFYDHYLSEADCGTAMLRMVAELRAAGQTFSPPKAHLQVIGDSITAEAGQTSSATNRLGSYGYRTLADLATSLSGGLYGLIGANTPFVTAKLDDLLPWVPVAYALGTKTILTCAMGANSSLLNNASSNPGLDFAAEIKAAFVDRIAATPGGVPVICQVLAKANAGTNVQTFETNRQAYNNYWKGLPAGLAAFVSYAGTVVDSLSAAQANNGFYDGGHPNGIGYDAMSPIYKQAITTLIASL